MNQNNAESIRLIVTTAYSICFRKIMYVNGRKIRMIWGIAELARLFSELRPSWKAISKKNRRRTRVHSAELMSSSNIYPPHDHGERLLFQRNEWLILMTAKLSYSIMLSSITSFEYPIHRASDFAMCENLRDPRRTGTSLHGTVIAEVVRICSQIL